MLSVAEAMDRLLSGLEPLPEETVRLADAYDRVLARDAAAKLTQPPFDSSAMDGYAVRRADVAELPATLRLIGESAAGHPFTGGLSEREAVRIFTGAVVPPGADHIVIQENTALSGDSVEIREDGGENWIRGRGIDFREGDVLLAAGRRLTTRDLLLAAQMNHAELVVRRRPKIAVLASGDELVPPGGTLQPGQIISSIPAGLVAMLNKAGADAWPLGIAADTMEALAGHIASADRTDLLVTIGGASVGDHDLVRKALEAAGYDINFHKVAMRPGKPIMSGRRGGRHVLGLPGNPVSAMMGGIIFLVPMIAALLGESRPPLRESVMPLAAPVEKNGPRQHYMRAAYVLHDGREAAQPLHSQDSSLTSVLAAADCLIVRPPHAPAAHAGTEVPILPLHI